MQRDGCLDALDDKHLEGPLHTTDRFRAIAALDDEFGNQRVIVRGYDGIGVSRPAEGTKVSGSSALIRHSMAWPDAMMAPVASSIFSPAAMRTCALIKSTPVTSSVTGCSTWMRVFISMK